jgi:hypothetical protein
MNVRLLMQHWGFAATGPEIALSFIVYLQPSASSTWAGRAGRQQPSKPQFRFKGDVPFL